MPLGDQLLASTPRLDGRSLVPTGAIARASSATPKGMVGIVVRTKRATTPSVLFLHTILRSDHYVLEYRLRSRFNVLRGRQHVATLLRARNERHVLRLRTNDV